MTNTLFWFSCVVIGGLSGVLASLLLHLLDFVTSLRGDYQGIVFCLPLAGFMIGWLHHRWPDESGEGIQFLLNKVNQSSNASSLMQIPLILFTTGWSHLFGASVGREATAVQLGAGVAAGWAHRFRVSQQDARGLLLAGAGAGFGAAIGAPWAGVLFGMEVLRFQGLSIRTLVACGITSFCAFLTSETLRTPHILFPAIKEVGFSWQAMIWVSVAGLCFGLLSIAFERSESFIKKIGDLTFRGSRVGIHSAAFRTMFGGVLIVMGFLILATDRYLGLGIPVIQEAFLKVMSPSDFFWKFIFTVVALGTGFKGGAFIPLVFIGATLGSALSYFDPTFTGLLATAGFTTIFATVSKTPFTCIIMGAELFGVSFIPYLVLSCFISRLVYNSTT